MMVMSIIVIMAITISMMTSPNPRSLPVLRQLLTWDHLRAPSPRSYRVFWTIKLLSRLAIIRLMKLGSNTKRNNFRCERIYGSCWEDEFTFRRWWWLWWWSRTWWWWWWWTNLPLINGDVLLDQSGNLDSLVCLDPEENIMRMLMCWIWMSSRSLLHLRVGDDEETDEERQVTC